MSDESFVPLQFVQRSHAEMFERAAGFYDLMQQRRTVRAFSDRSVPQCVMEKCIHTAGTAPSGAHQQPWHFALIGDHNVKTKIRAAAEIEEQEFYDHRASDEWLRALEPFATTASKPFLETAPWLIAVFVQKHALDADGRIVKHYYPVESTGIATGLLIAALHNCGVATLTHTPSPMKFLNQILKRPDSERPFVLLVAGYPANDCQVPDIDRKSLNEICSMF